jgi:hypothetical protein
MSVSKRFNRKLFEENDKRAKEALFDIFKDNKKYYIQENKRKYEVDILVFSKKDDNLVCYIECEIKGGSSWKDGEFKYSDVNLPQRKEKHCWLDAPCIFIVFNKDNMKEYLTYTSNSVLKSPLVEVQNRFVAKGEMFYKINMNKCSKNDIFKTIKELKI